MHHEANFFAHPSAIIDEGCQVGEGTKIWHFSHLMAGAVIGENCLIGQNVFVADQVQIGNNVKVQNNVSLYEGVICEDDVFIGPSVVFTNVINPRSAVSRKDQYQKTIIRKGATIGANATIVCGNEIEEYAFIGAGAVVTKSVMAYALVIGNPARQTDWVSEFGHKLQFDGDGKAVCSESGAIYQLQDGRMLRFLTLNPKLKTQPSTLP
ncbi:MAG: N-acetyltransferase [Chitinophagaceae bacterium]|nr:N-acetyltransferase [Chitinophagaceae bacterium]